MRGIRAFWRIPKRGGKACFGACWDRSRARPALDGGLPLLLFRLQGGFTIHRGDVSLSPPIMPYGRISQVRFEALACRLWTFPSPTRFKRWCAYARQANSLFTTSSLSLTTVWYARFYQAEPAPGLAPRSFVRKYRATCDASHSLQ